MIYRLANKKDCFKIAEIHFQEIKWGFLSRLGEKFLCYFYQAMVNSQNAFLIIAEDNNSVIGFVSGCANLKKFYKEFIRKYGFKVSFILLRKFFSPNIVGKILETMKYSGQEKKDLPKAELLGIAVLSEFQGQGISRQLLDSFFIEMKKRNIESFKVIVGENLDRAVRFYEKNDFKFHSKSFVHKDMPSRIYIYNIENRQL